MKFVLWLSFSLSLLHCITGHAAPIKYALARPTNTDQAILDWGYFTTNGVIGENVKMVFGQTLIDYAVHITEGEKSVLLTPENSSLGDSSAFFDITEDKIQLLDNQQDFFNTFIIQHNDHRKGFVFIHQFTDPYGASMLVSADSSGNSADSQTIPFTIATAIPEPSTTALSLCSLLLLTARRWACVCSR